MTFIPPMLAIDEELPTGGDWLYQIKWDGIRCVASIDQGKVVLYNRSGMDITVAFPEVVEGLETIFSGDQVSLVLDGEIVVHVDKQQNFPAAIKRCGINARNKAEILRLANPACFFVFDRIDESMQKERYIDRYNWCRERFEPYLSNKVNVRMNPCVSDLEQAKDAVARMKLEGIVARNANGLYYPAERAEIIRWKDISTIDAYIYGYEKGSGIRENNFGAFLLAVPEGFSWRYIGKVSSGISDQELSALLSSLVEITTEPPVDNHPSLGSVQYVKPTVVVEVAQLGYEETGELRNPAFVRRREDKELK